MLLSYRGNEGCVPPELEDLTRLQSRAALVLSAPCCCHRELHNHPPSEYELVGVAVASADVPKLTVVQMCDLLNGQVRWSPLRRGPVEARGLTPAGVQL